MGRDAEALAQISEMATLVNESIRDKENAQQLRDLQELMPGLALVKAGRVLRYQGELVKVCRKGPQARSVLLVRWHAGPWRKGV